MDEPRYDPYKVMGDLKKHVPIFSSVIRKRGGSSNKWKV